MLILPPDLFTMLNYLSGSEFGSEMRKGMLVIWNAVLLLLWKRRNQGIFEDRNGDHIEVLEEIKVVSWQPLYLLTITIKH
jgi:hypothetical protein